MSFPPYGVTVPSLSNLQLSYGGVVMGASSPYLITEVDGLDLPTIRSADTARSRDHGELVGIDLASGRDITITAQIKTDGTSLQSAMSALASAMLPGAATESPLWIQQPNRPLLAAMCRVRKRTSPMEMGYAVSSIAQLTALLHSTDYRLYAAPQQSVVGLGTPLGGLTFPVTFPATFGGGTVAGIITANNAGNVESRPLLIITGPCTNPTVMNATTGWSLSFSNADSGGLTLNAGDTLTIDTDLRTITYVASGTTAGTPRANWLVPGSIWPNPITPILGLAVGNNIIEFTSSDATAVAGTLTLQWASAYLI